MSKYSAADIRELTGVEDVLASYLASLVWVGRYYESEEAGERGEGEPLEEAGFTAADIPDDIEREAREDVEAFLVEVRRALRSHAVRPGLTAEQIGHDFNLTRNRHGAGFWDRGWGRLGERLTAIAHAYGSQSLEAWTDSAGAVQWQLIDG